MTEREIFIAAVQQGGPGERATYLQEACGGDIALRERIEALLREYDQLGSYLEPLGPVATIDEPIAERAGTVIGPYKLLEQIGEGGFGVVFMAEQIAPVRRKVALKVIKPGMDTRQVIARFEAERQALALMEHPNIARVLDAGTTDGSSRHTPCAVVDDGTPRAEADHGTRSVPTSAGRPYFVMELVRGTSMTEYCDQHNLPIQERLELFFDVCQAVQHAHQKGIIHRDIKPSNVLVTLHDGKPVVKVIDFGIAKAMGQQLTEKTLFTNFAQMIGTPLYMSPEQAEMSALDVDTRSDIYSLGVLLYELLTGATPCDKERMRRAAFDEIRRIIREEEPPKPSTRMSTLGQAATTASEKRQSDPRKLSRLFRGELDWIVMKALEKDRNRRYETASAFAADVGRYLKDEAVLACPPSAGYRLRKFVRRNKGPVAAAACLLLGLAGLGGGIGWAVRDRAAAAEERDREQATRQAEIDREVNRALEEAGGNLDAGRLSEAQAAIQRAENFLAAAGPGAPGSSPQLLELRMDLGMVQRLEDIGVNPKNQEFTSHYKQDAAYLEAFSDYGVDLGALSVEEAAEKIRSRRIRLDLVRALDSWSGRRRAVVRSQSAPQQGEKSPTWRQLLEIATLADPDPSRAPMRAALGRNDRNALEAQAASADIAKLQPQTLYLLGTALYDLGGAEQAVALLRRAQLQYPEDWFINNILGWYCLSATVPQYDDAARFYSAAQAVRPGLAINLCGMGEALMGKNAWEDAVVVFSRAIELAPPAYLHPWQGRAKAYLALGKPEKAIADLSKVIEIDSKKARHWNDRGNAYARAQQWDQAHADFTNAIELASSTELNSANDHNSVAWLLATCADPKCRNGARAVELAKKAVGLAPTHGTYWNTLGAAHYAAGDWKEAIAALEKSMDLSKGGDGFDWFFLAMAHWQLGEKDQARAWHTRAMAWMEKTAPQHEELLRFRAEAEELLGVKEKKM